MKNRKILMILVITFMLLILGVGLFFLIKGDNYDLKNISVIDSDAKDFSEDIVFDGNHYKISDPIFEEENNLFISLNDLKEVIPIEITENNNEMKISHNGESILYNDKVIQNSNANENEVQQYRIKNEIIYIPERHIEKYLGVEVTYFYDSKTKTVALTSRKEQQLEKIDQQLGSTIFIEKNNVQTEKFEPRNGLYLGGYVIQDEYINASMNTFNEITNKQHASYFRYVGYGKPFPEEWVENVKSVGGFPQIAWEPNNGLDEVIDDDYLREFAKSAKEAGVPILLRYASEMNGTWVEYSGDPEQYIEKWKLIHDVMEEEAPNVMMLWNVFTMPEGTIDEYYPGDEYVDYVGVNIYNVVYHNDKLNNRSDFEDPLRLLDYVYNKYSHKKPIVIGEFGATNYTVTDGLYHVEFAREKIRRMYKYLPILYPRVKFIYYFDVNNLVNAPEGRKINNYAITENPIITNAYKEYVTNNNEYLSSYVEASSSANETFSYRDFMFYFNGELYVDHTFFSDYLDMKLDENRNTFEITSNDQTYEFISENHSIDKAAFFEKRDLTGLPIIEVLDQFEFEYELKQGDIHININ